MPQEKFLKLKCPARPFDDSSVWYYYSKKTVGSGSNLLCGI